jgi:hypothetical protein
MDNEKKKAVCEIMKKEIEDSVQTLSQLKDLGTPVSLLDKEQKIIERKSKYFENFCVIK